MAGTGRRLGWLVLTLLGIAARAEEGESEYAAPSRELLLYLAEFESGDAEPLDPLALESLPDSAVDSNAEASATEGDDERR